MKKIYCIQGYTGSGKDTVLNKISKELGIPKIVSTTTRPKREGELEGVTYYYKDIMDKDEYISFRSYETVEGVWSYGISKGELKTEGESLVILDREGVEELKKLEGVEVVTIYLEVRESIIRERVKERGDKEEELERRLKSDKEAFKDYKADYRVENEGCLIKTVEKVKKIIGRERTKSLLRPYIKQFVRDNLPSTYSDIIKELEEMKEENEEAVKEAMEEGVEEYEIDEEDYDIYKFSKVEEYIYSTKEDEELREKFLEELEDKLSMYVIEGTLAKLENEVLEGLDWEIIYKVVEEGII